MESIDDIFLNARELHDPDKRAAYLADVCAGDVSLRTQVEAMLRDAEGAENFFRDSLAASTYVTGAPGTMIGRYRLLQKIGEGGMGVVYMAEQRDPVVRKVALKIIKLGMDTRQVIARFEAERQALALMDHPNIAKVLDGGTTQTGRPYFVMDLVQGLSITQFCDEAQLSTRERLDLFLHVCSAIQHAHQKGIIHRDIKPSNILVTLHGDKPVPKVIDFGIAKATQQPLTDKTLFTQFQAFIGTPAYISPEQASLSGLDVDTRSDIYALGVLLYELLTGKTPFDGKALLKSGIDEMCRTIREKEPPRPSTRLTTLEQEELTTAAKRHRTEATKLIHTVRGDLDWIVMKCLEKDRTRRYDTANSLAADLERHLNNEPVLACPPSVGYRFQKLAQRNKVAFTAAATITIVLMLASFISIWQAVRATSAERKATSEARTAQAVKDFLVEQVLAVNPFIEPEPDPNRLALAQRIARKLDGKFPDEPPIEAELRWAIGGALAALGDRTNAEVEFRRTYEIRRQILGPNHSDTLWAACFIAQMCGFTGRTNEALNLLLPLLPRTRRPLKELTSGEGEVLFSYGAVLNMMGNTEEALRHYEPALEVARRTMDTRNWVFKNKLSATARAKATAGKLEEAEALFREALRESQQQFPPDHPLVLQFEKGLAGCLYRRGRLQDAVPIYKRIIPMHHRVLGTNHSMTFDCELCLGEIYYAEGRVQDALALYASLHPRWADLCKFPALRNSPRLGARLFVQERRFDDARTMLVPIRKSFQDKPPRPQDLPSYLEFESSWAKVLDAEGKDEEATAVRVAAITESVKDSLPPPDAVSQIARLVRTLQEQKRYKEIRQALAPLVRTNKTTIPQSSEESELMVAATAAANGWPAAAELCRRDFDRFSDSLGTWLNKAWIFRYVGDDESYQRVVVKILTVAPNVLTTNDQHVPIEIAALGSSPFSAGQIGHLDAMISELEAALSGRPVDLQSYGNLAIGLMQLRLGRFTKCLEALEKSPDLAGPNPYKLFIQTICLHRMGRSAEARATLEKAKANMDPRLLSESLGQVEDCLPASQLYQQVLMHREAQALLKSN
jgi:serine/threonine protein kinase